MTKKKKALAAILAVALIVCVATGATLAYLADKTEEAVNTFTLGKVDIMLDEAVIDENGEATDERTEEGNFDENGYHILPGQTVDKDPTVTVFANSEDCYVRVFVTMDNAENFLKVYLYHGMSIDKALEFFKGFDETVWVPQNLSAEAYDEESDTITVEFRYFEVVEKSDEDQGLKPVITKVTLPDFVTNQDCELFPEGFKVTVVAEAIQAKGFDDEDAAWTAFDEANPAITPYVAPTNP